jgi:hypothetical protein
MRIYIYNYISADPADGKGERVREDITISQGQDMIRENSKSQKEGSRETKTARSKSTRAKWQRDRKKGRNGAKESAR